MEWINGVERIGNVTELSATPRTRSRLRKQFLPCLPDGVLIGNCLLTQTSPDVSMSAYSLPRRVLAIVLNPHPEASLTIPYDLAPWSSGGATFATTELDERKTQAASRTVPAVGPSPVASRVAQLARCFDAGSRVGLPHTPSGIMLLPP